MKNETKGFHGLGIAPKLLEILDELGYVSPTPIQAQAIPASLDGKDLIGIAQTGTGKTLAFGVPMLQLLAVHKGTGLVVLPTRELALQVNESLQEIGSKLGLRTVVLIGGEKPAGQLKGLKRKPHIVVATPGRLMDLAGQGAVKLQNTRVLVLDEADMMLDMGFLPQIKEILKMLPKARQTMLFSATMPAQIAQIAAQHMSLPIRVTVAPAGTPSEMVEQEIFVVAQSEKFGQLKKVLTETKGSVLVFCRTKHGTKNLAQKVRNAGIQAAEIHSNRTLVQRRQAMEGFRKGRYRVLVATDIASRGIDVSGIELVVNYDLPTNSEDYVHRIGRTGRAGNIGKAISFSLPSQFRDIKNIERLTNQRIKVTALTKETYARPQRPESRTGEKKFKKPYKTRRQKPVGKTGDKKSYRAAKPKFQSRPKRSTERRKPDSSMTDRQRFLASMKTGR